MTASASYFPRNPKFNDAFERELANDTAYHLSRDEPSTMLPVINGIGRALAAVAHAVLFLRACAQHRRVGVAGS
jgi:hypothetical protein